MICVEGFYDGECVKLKENVDAKNQRVIVTFVEEFLNKSGLTKAEHDAIRDAISDDTCVSKETTNYDVDAFIRESRGYE